MSSFLGGDKMKKELNIIEVCGGIGASKKALEKLGIKTKAVDYIENNNIDFKPKATLNPAKDIADRIEKQ